MEKGLAKILLEETKKAKALKRKREEDNSEEEIVDPGALCDAYVEKNWKKMMQAAKNGKDLICVKPPTGIKKAKAIKEELEKEGFKVKWDGRFSYLCWERIFH